MTIVGYAQDPDTATTTVAALLSEIAAQSEVSAVKAGRTVGILRAGANAPAELTHELTWLADKAVEYLEAPLVVCDFSSEAAYEAWLMRLDPTLQNLALHNRMRHANMARASRLVAGLTTEAFAGQLNNNRVHDAIHRAYTDFSDRYPLASFYSFGVTKRAETVEVLSDTLVLAIRELLAIGFLSQQQ